MIITMRRQLKFKLSQSGVCEDVYTYNHDGKHLVVVRQRTQDAGIVKWLSATRTTGYYNTTEYEASAPLKRGLIFECYKNGKLQGVETIEGLGYADKKFNFSWEETK